MCRIYGFFQSFDTSLKQMGMAGQKQIAGGPDEQCLSIRHGWGIGINRLAIESPSGGHQPYVHGSVSVVFNGEIYNHQKIRSILTQKGYQIDDMCDGAIIPSLYIEYGMDFVQHLDGMYAIAIIDNREEPKLLLVSDHLAIKPLYYFQRGESIWFASEMGGLLELLPAKPSLDPDVIRGYFSLQSIPIGMTPYRGVKRLLPGEAIVAQGDTTRSTITSPPLQAPFSGTFECAGENLLALMRSELSQMSRTNMPFALKLSGGLDSSFLATLLAEVKSDVRGYHISYDCAWDKDERAFAVSAARRAGIDLVHVVAEVADIPAQLPSMVRAMGLPNAAPHALSSYLLFGQMARDGFRVCVSGEGADEQFGGYRRHYRSAFDDADDWWERYLSRIQIAESDEYRRFLGANDRGDFRLQDITSPAHPEVPNSINSRVKKMLQFDRYVKLPSFNLSRLDHLSMAHAIEVRVPFCQVQVSSFAGSLPTEHFMDRASGKRVLYEAARGYVPDEVWQRDKQPFTLPLENMLAADKRVFAYFADLLAESALARDHMLSRVAILQELEKPSPNWRLLWSLAVLELWWNEQQQGSPLIQ